MFKAYKYRLNLTSEQVDYFESCFGCARLVYNLGLATKIQTYGSLKQKFKFL